MITSRTALENIMAIMFDDNKVISILSLVIKAENLAAYKKEEDKGGEI